MLRGHRIELALAGAKLVLCLVLLRGYGVFRDELYYFACADHLDWGYVDHAPLIAWVTAAARWLGAESHAQMRVVPALSSAATVLATGVVAGRLGGNAPAKLLACAGVIVAPYFLVTGHIHTMNAVEPLLWTLSAMSFTRAVERRDVRSWAASGGLLGVALLNKHSTLFLGFALAVALVADRRRRVFLTRGPWVALGIAALLVAPNVAWQVEHGWPTLEFMRNARSSKHVALSFFGFLKEQAMLMHPATVPIWVAGLVHLLRNRAGDGRRMFGVAFVVLFVVFAATGGKPYYLAPAYPILLAAGGVAIERALRQRALLASAVAAAVVLGLGCVTAPLAIPVLSAHRVPGYMQALGITPKTGEKWELGPLPQLFADMFGWPELTHEVALAYRALPEEERGRALILAENYGMAGAIDHFGPSEGLPRASSGHNGYYLWGPTLPDPDVVIAVGLPEKRLRDAFDEVTQVGTFDHPLSMPKDRNVPIFVCRRPVRPFADLWPTFKRFL